MQATAALLALLVALPGALFWRERGPASDGGGRPPADRVLVLSVPHVMWRDLDGDRTPALHGLLERSAIANLSVRTAQGRTTAGDGYLTVGAGTRAGAPPDGAGLALAAGERFEAGTAADAYRRRLGFPLEGVAAMLSLPAYRERNDQLLYEAKVGALGDALDDAGMQRAVIANADQSASARLPSAFSRQAVAALIDHKGALSAGRVDRGLLRLDRNAAFGLALDPPKVLSAFRAAWRDHAVVLVEASDLARADAYRQLVGDEAGQRLFEGALRSTDEMVAALLTNVDLSRHAVLVIAPVSPTGPSRLTLAGLAAPGQQPGLLRSSSTRRSGFVALTDVAPTVLALLGVPADRSMDGRPLVLDRPGGSYGPRLAALVAAERDARFRDDLLFPVAWGFVIAQLVLSATAILVLRRPGRGRPLLEVASLALLGVLPFTYLAALAPFADWGVPAYAAFLGLGGISLGCAAWGLGGRPGRLGGATRRSLLPLELVLASIAGVLLVSALTGSPLQLSTVFGDSPIVGGRFTGINNMSFAQLVVAAFLLAGFLVHRLGAGRGAAAAMALLVAVLVVDGAPMWGSDVGGILAIAPAVVVVAFMLRGWRLGPRAVLVGVGGTVAAVAIFGLLDLSRPSTRRTHLGRLFEQIDTDGWRALSEVVERKLVANLSAITHSVWTVMVPAALAFIGWLVYRSPSVLAAIKRQIPELRFALAGIVAVGSLGFALNDSGIAVPGMMLGVLNPSLIYLGARFGSPVSTGRRSTGTASTGRRGSGSPRWRPSPAPPRRNH